MGVAEVEAHVEGGAQAGHAARNAARRFQPPAALPLLQNAGEEREGRSNLGRGEAEGEQWGEQNGREAGGHWTLSSGRSSFADGTAGVPRGRSLRPTQIAVALATTDEPMPEIDPTSVGETEQERGGWDEGDIGLDCGRRVFKTMYSGARR